MNRKEQRRFVNRTLDTREVTNFAPEKPMPSLPPSYITRKQENRDNPEEDHDTAPTEVDTQESGNSSLNPKRTWIILLLTAGITIIALKEGNHLLKELQLNQISELTRNCRESIIRIIEALYHITSPLK